MYSQKHQSENQTNVTIIYSNPTVHLAAYLSQYLEYMPPA